MTPQISLMIAARIAAQRAPECRRVLASMNAAPGRVDPLNELLPFAKFERLHFARILIIDDRTQADIAVYDVPPGNEPQYVAFLADVDGDVTSFLRELTQSAAAGLRTIFSFCDDFDPAADLFVWLRAHEVRPAVRYGNWRGRTARRIREEAALHDALRSFAAGIALEDLAPQETHRRARAFVAAEKAGGRLTLTPEAPTPPGWWFANLVHLVGVPLLLLVGALPLAAIGTIALLRIRALERTDPEICPRDTPEHVATLAVLEDHADTNQFSAMGSLKPGALHRWVAVFILWVSDYATRHVYTRGRLARVRTIHSANWIFLDGRRRLLFVSNYDGSLDSYNDDFINKVAYGLNLTFSGGTGYPKSRWLILDGAKNEQKFKHYLRRHQLPAEVWYDAHPGLTAIDRERNGRIRDGVESPSLRDDEARQWAMLL